MRTDQALAIVEDLARHRAKPAAKMEVSDALELAGYLNGTPDGVVAAHKLREAVRVLARAVSQQQEKMGA